MVVLSDHKNLTYFRTTQKLNDWQAQWSLYLSEFNIKLIHMPKMKMIQLDTLSRHLDHRTNKSTRREDQILLTDDLFVNLLDIDLQECILNAKDLDTNIKNIIETIQKNGPTNLLNDITNWKIEINRHKTIFYKGKNYIPRDQDLQHDIVKMFHDHKTAGHLGKLETYNLVKVHYWWPGMHMFIKNYVQGCGHCQQFKINRSPANPAYQPIAGAKTTRPFELLHGLDHGSSTCQW